MSRAQRTKQRIRFGALPLIISGLVLVLSLGSVLAAQAMPVEARITEAWYTYHSKVGFNFAAKVKTGSYYDTPVMQPQALIQVQEPVQPPVFHRVLISQLTDELDVTVPYEYKADRPASLHVSWRIDGMLVLPGYWQKPYPLLAQKDFTIEGTEAAGVESFRLSVAPFLRDIEQNRTVGIMSEPLELHIRPVLQIQADGLKQPVAVTNAPEYTIVFRQATVTVDEPREATLADNLSETRMVPITLSLLGLDLPVGMVRQVSLIALVSVLAIASILLWTRRQRPDYHQLLQRLGSNVIAATTFELRGEISMVQIREAREFLQLQVQADRPVIRVGDDYYLQDGTICYHLKVGQRHTSDPATSGKGEA
jgi:hypothetical protein